MDGDQLKDNYIIIHPLFSTFQGKAQRREYNVDISLQLVCYLASYFQAIAAFSQCF